MLHAKVAAAAAELLIAHAVTLRLMAGPVALVAPSISRTARPASDALAALLEMAPRTTMLVVVAVVVAAIGVRRMRLAAIRTLLEVRGEAANPQVAEEDGARALRRVPRLAADGVAVVTLVPRLAADGVRASRLEGDGALVAATLAAVAGARAASNVEQNNVTVVSIGY